MDEFTLMRKYAELNRFNAKLKSCPFCGCEASLVFYKTHTQCARTVTASRTSAQQRHRKRQ